MLLKAQEERRRDNHRNRNENLCRHALLSKQRIANWHLVFQTVIFPLLMVVLIIAVVSVRTSYADHTGGAIPLDDIKIQIAICKLFYLIEGSFGALVMVVAGILAIIAAVNGAYKSGINLIYVGAGAFILRSLVSLFFGDYGCGAGFGSGSGIEIGIGSDGIGISGGLDLGAVRIGGGTTIPFGSSSTPPSIPPDQLNQVLAGKPPPD